MRWTKRDAFYTYDFIHQTQQMYDIFPFYLIFFVNETSQMKILLDLLSLMYEII